MYKFEEICELIELVGSSGVAVVEIEHAGSRVRVEGRLQAAAAPTAPQIPAPGEAAAVPAPQTASAAVDLESASADAVDEDEHAINSPIVGTFYRAPNPDADPYVKVGDFVEQGQTLCIIEAMKLMNEIESEVAGTIKQMLVKDGDPVEYDQPLFVIETA